LKIFIDTGHPVHILFFNPIFKQLKKNGHSVYFAIREKDCSVHIAKSLNINYISKGKGSYSIFKKPFYLIASIIKLYQIAKQFKPDIFLSFASPYAGIVACLNKKPHLVFDDTEPDPIVQSIYRIFSSIILNSISNLSSGKYLAINSDHSIILTPSLL